MGTFLSSGSQTGSEVMLNVSGLPFTYTNLGYAVVAYYGGGLRTTGTVQHVTRITVTGANYGSTSLVGLNMNDTSSWKVLPSNSQTDAGTKTPAGNVMVFRGLHDSAFSLSVTGGSSTDGSRIGVLNGIQIVPLPSLPTLPPIITSSLIVTGTVGKSFSYQIKAEGNPTSYETSGLPEGLVLAPSTGAITGTPAKSGIYLVSLKGLYPNTSTEAILTLTIESNNSPRLLDLAMYAGITVGGEPGQTCRIEYVDAFGDTNAWATLTTLVLTNSTQFYLDQDSGIRSKRFYRVVWMP
jgi:hypothetical protein